MLPSNLVEPKEMENAAVQQCTAVINQWNGSGFDPL
jgi:hypothetical protein